MEKVKKLIAGVLSLCMILLCTACVVRSEPVREDETKDDLTNFEESNENSSAEDVSNSNDNRNDGETNNKGEVEISEKDDADTSEKENTFKPVLVYDKPITKAQVLSNYSYTIRAEVLQYSIKTFSNDATITLEMKLVEKSGTPYLGRWYFTLEEVLFYNESGKFLGSERLIGAELTGHSVGDVFTGEIHNIPLSTTKIVIKSENPPEATFPQNVKTYTSYPYAPDYGAMLGISYDEKYDSETYPQTSYAYRYENVMNVDPNAESGANYIALLNECGYESQGTVEVSGETYYSFYHKESGTRVRFGKVSEIQCIVVIVAYA